MILMEHFWSVHPVSYTHLDVYKRQIQIRLTGEAAEKYDIYYRVHCQDDGWLGWAKNGEKAGRCV